MAKPEKIEKLYRARGVHNITKRDSWISKHWDRTKKDAETTIRIYGAKKQYTNIRIIVATNRTYKNKYIRGSSISPHYDQ